MSGLLRWLDFWEKTREKVPAERTVALYPGRFQPFGRHHQEAYNYLKETFGEVCLVTSGRTDGGQNPFDFEEKRRLIAGYGIPPKRVLRRDRLTPKEILRALGFEPRTTAAVVGFGAKDLALQKEFAKHFTPLPANGERPLPSARRSYFTIVHLSTLPLVQGRPLSGTLTRELLGDPSSSPEMRRQAFRECFGWYDEETFAWVVAKLARKAPERA